MYSLTLKNQHMVRAYFDSRHSAELHNAGDVPTLRWRCMRYQSLQSPAGKLYLNQVTEFQNNYKLYPLRSQLFDDIIFAFFSLEMTIKMMAMGMWGKNTYLADSWNRLDFFIVVAGAFEYCLHMENLNLTAIRTIRVLRPLRAINRIPSEC